MSWNRPLFHSFFVVLCLVGLNAVPAWAQSEHMNPEAMVPSIPSLSGDQVSRLNAGEILIDTVQGPAPIGDVMGIISHSPETVMTLVANFELHSEFYDDVSFSETVGQEGDYHLLHGITDTPWPMDDREWVLRAAGAPTQVDGVDVILSTWAYIPDSGNLVDTQGYYLAIPWGNDGSKCLLRYRIQVDLGTWLPDFLLTWSQENFLPNKIRNIQSWLDTH